MDAPSGPEAPPRVSVAAPAAVPGQELIEMRTEMSKTFATATAGELESKLFAQPVHFRDGQGVWQEISTELRPVAGGKHKSTAGPVGVTVAAKADADALTTVDLGEGVSVGWSLGAAFTKARPGVGGRGQRAEPSSVSPAKVKQSTAVFADALPGVDVELTATSSGVKEDLVLSGPDVATVFTFPLALDGVDAAVQPDGSVALREPGGRLRASIPAGWMADASGAFSSAVTYALLPSADAAGDPVLQVTVDPVWLADPARVFPVRVDPSLTATAATDDTYAQSNATSTDFSTSSVLKVGRSSSFGGAHRSFLHFDVSSLRGKYINYADLNAYAVRASSCTPAAVTSYEVTQPWTGSAVRWPGPSTTTDLGTVTTSAGCSPGWTGMRISQAVRRWTSLDGTGTANHGVMLAANESDPAAYREFASADTASAGAAPYVFVNWREPVLGRLGHYTMNDSTITDRVGVSVNTATGNLLVSGADVSVPGDNGMDAEVLRSYNSREDSARAGATGTGWTLSGGQDIRLSVNGLDRSAVFEGPSGYRVTFFWNRSTNNYDQPSGLNASLVSNSTASYDFTLTLWDQALRYRFAGGAALTSVQDFTGANTISYGYDSAGRATTITDTRSGVTRLAYGTNGLLSSVTDPFGRAVRYGYTGTDLTSTTDQSGKITRYGYTGDHNLASITDPRGFITRIGYDSADRVTLITWADSTSTRPVRTTYSYPSAGITWVTDPRGNRTTYAFTSNGRGEAKSVSAPRGQVATAAYNANSSVTSYTTPQGGTGAISYLGGGYNVATASSPTGGQSTFSYTNASAPNRPSDSINPQGIKSVYSFNAQYQLESSSTGTAGTSTTYRTSTQPCTGAVDRTTEANQAVTSYEYDGRCRLISTTPPAPLGRTTQTWDTLDRLATVTDGTGGRQQFTYDTLDRVSRIDYSQGTGTVSSSVTYSYDANGNPTGQVDSGSGQPTLTTSRTLDARGRVSAETLPSVNTVLIAGSYSNSYSYDTAGNLESMTTPAGRTAYGYDAANDVTSMTPPGSPTITWTRYEAISAAVVFPNGVTDVQRYAPDGRIRRIEHYRNSGGTYTGYAGLDYDYVNPATGKDTGQLYAVRDTARGLTQTYRYDTLGRISSGHGVSNGNVFENYTYAYDDNGNRTSWTESGRQHAATYNAANQMTSRTGPGGTATFGYDANGNPTSSTAGEAYSYDLKRRATSTKTDSGSGARAMTYSGNDAFNRLKAGSRTFRSSILGITSQTDIAGTTTFLRDPTGRVLGQTGPDGKTWYYLSDRLGSITGLTDSTGARVNSFGYGPYGEYTYGSDASSTFGPVVPWKFTGGYRDNDRVSGPALYKLGIRYYNPDTGRFTQPDPTGQDPHYLYAGNNPVNFIDPSGAGLVEAIVGSIVGAALTYALTQVAVPLPISLAAGACAGAFVEEALSNTGIDYQQAFVNCVKAGVAGFVGGATLSALNRVGAYVARRLE